MKATRKSKAPAKPRANPAGASRGTRRIKCACLSCQCTMDMDNGFRKDNRVYCSRICFSRCTREQCYCEHDHCLI